MTIGIDVGISTTKIIGLKNNTLIEPALVEADDPIVSLFGAFGKFLNQNKLLLSDINKIMLTGVGSSYIKKPIYGVPTYKVDEFLCNGLGGLFLANLEKSIVLSLGTGTALIEANRNNVKHIGGTGIGGGTIIGLSKLLLNTDDITYVSSLAINGNISNINLNIGDILQNPELNLSLNLPKDMTVSNFGKINGQNSKNDIALGIFNLVFESIASYCILASKTIDIKDIVVIGNLSTSEFGKQIFEKTSKFFDVNFIVPENSAFATSIGAALAESINCETIPMD